MELVQNVPFFSIMLSMFSGIVSSVLPRDYARRLNNVMITVVGGMSAWLLFFLQNSSKDANFSCAFGKRS